MGLNNIMLVIFYIFLAVICVSIVSLIGVAVLGVNEKKLHRWSTLFVSLAVGTMLGSAFLHIIPEVKSEDEMFPYLLVLAGLVLVFIIEKYFHWRHCHEEH
jgi:zinc and cadmium transporter